MTHSHCPVSRSLDAISLIPMLNGNRNQDCRLRGEASVWMGKWTYLQTLTIQLV